MLSCKCNVRVIFLGDDSPEMCLRIKCQCVLADHPCQQAYPHLPPTVQQQVWWILGHNRVAKPSKFEYHVRSAHFLSFLEPQEHSRGDICRGPTALGERWEGEKGNRWRDMLPEEEPHQCKVCVACKHFDKCVIPRSILPACQFDKHRTLANSHSIVPGLHKDSLPSTLYSTNRGYGDRGCTA